MLGVHFSSYNRSLRNRTRQGTCAAADGGDAASCQRHHRPQRGGIQGRYRPNEWVHFPSADLSGAGGAVLRLLHRLRQWVDWRRTGPGVAHAVEGCRSLGLQLRGGLVTDGVLDEYAVRIRSAKLLSLEASLRFELVAQHRYARQPVRLEVAGVVMMHVVHEPQSARPVTNRSHSRAICSRSFCGHGRLNVGLR